MSVSPLPAHHALLTALQQQCLLPILRLDNPHICQRLAESLYQQGFKVLEITLTTPRALEIIQQLALAGAQVGAGTVLNVQEAEQALDHGAQFLISPGFSPEISQLAQAHQVAYFPGVFSATEVMLALDQGLTTLKLFPASSLGTGYLKHLKGPFPQVHWLPTGGIELADVPQWLAAGALAVGQGTRLVSAEHLKAGNWQAIDQELQQVQQQIQSWQQA